MFEKKIYNFKEVLNKNLSIEEIAGVGKLALQSPGTKVPQQPFAGGKLQANDSSKEKGEIPQHIGFSINGCVA